MRKKNTQLTGDPAVVLQRVVRCQNRNHKMKSAIIYSQKKPTSDHQLLMCLDEKKRTLHRLYIRAEVVEADALHALDMAKPREGETVLNAAELP